MARRTLKLSNPREIRASLAKVTNMVYNGELDPKQANCITLCCNAILGTLKTFEALKPENNITQEDENSMKTNRQYTVQSLLRMAEITGDEHNRTKWLAEAERLLFGEAPGVTGKLTVKKGAIIEVQGAER